MKILVSSLSIFIFTHTSFGITLDTSKEVETISKKYLGDPYVWGGVNPDTGMDCSGYTKYVFNKVGIKIPRTAYAQSRVGKDIDKVNLKKGDLLFFLTDKKRNIPITHVGIYLGNNKFIHAASTKKGIIISPFRGGSYEKKFVVAKRVINKQQQFKKNMYITLDEEVLKSSMSIKITSFGGIHDTF